MAQNLYIVLLCKEIGSWLVVVLFYYVFLLCINYIIIVCINEKCYNFNVAQPNPSNRRRCATTMLFDFFIAVMAGIVSGVAVHYICKWLDS